MTILQRLLVKQSALREKINVLLGLETRTEDQDAELVTLTAEGQAIEIEIAVSSAESMGASPGTERREELKAIAAVGLVVLVFGGLVVFFVSMGIDMSKSSKSRHEQGFHCLSAWEGSHTAFKNDVRSLMFDPDSFDHIKTLVGPEVNGRHTIAMEFRLRDRFGVIDIVQARGYYRNDGCKHTLSGLVSMTAP